MAPTVPNIKLNSGYEMPQVGFGLWKVDNDLAADTVYNAIKVGYRLFDGACGKQHTYPAPWFDGEFGPAQNRQRRPARCWAMAGDRGTALRGSKRQRRSQAMRQRMEEFGDSKQASNELPRPLFTALKKSSPLPSHSCYPTSPL